MANRELTSFLRYYRTHAPLLACDLFAVALHAGFTVAIPFTAYFIFTDCLGDPARTLKGTTALAALVVCTGILEWAYIQVGHFLGVRVETEMRNHFFAHIQRLPFAYFDRTKTGDIMSRITSDLMLVAETSHHLWEEITAVSLTVTGAFIVMFSLNPALAGITLLPLPLIVFFASRFQRGIHRNLRAVREQVSAINSQVENAVQGIREVKAFTRERHEIDAFSEINNRFRLAWEKVYSLYAPFFAGTQFLVQCYSILYIAAGAWMVGRGTATAAEVLVFFMYSRYVTQPVIRVINCMDMFQQGFVGYRRFREIIREEPEPDAPGAPALDVARVRGEIVFSHVHFTYPGALRPVLNDVSLTIPAGKTVALVGPSGAGKTTLAALIPRFYDLSSGEIRLDGIPITTLRKQDLRSVIGIVSQRPFLFDTTIRNNVLFGRAGASDADVIAALRSANIAEFVLDLPRGLDTPIGENGILLSGGQRQRIAIARVFLKNPSLLIFDEATSALDTISESAVQEAMCRLCAGRTTLIIAHRLSTVRHADMIFHMEGGAIAESGTHLELLAKNGLYAALCEAVENRI